MDRRSRTAQYWKPAAAGVAIVVLTALATGIGVIRWSERTRDVPPAALPAAAAELPPRTVAVPDGGIPTSVTEACDGEALRVIGVTLATKKKMREIRAGQKYRAAYASCLRASGYTSS